MPDCFFVAFFCWWFVIMVFNVSVVVRTRRINREYRELLASRAAKDKPQGQEP